MNDYFHFKKFSVSHHRSSMKVGTDGVLLGAWVNLHDARMILDIGTGTGIIALMLAQRNAGALIDAVEVDEDSFLDASENFSKSPWAARLHVYHTSIQNFHPQKNYDLIISNPPYFVKSLKPSLRGRQLARHTDSLPFNELLQCAQSLLHPEGTLAIVLPLAEAQIFKSHAARHQLHIMRECSVRSRNNKSAIRLLMEYASNPKALEDEELCLYDENGDWLNTRNRPVTSTLKAKLSAGMKN